MREEKLLRDKEIGQAAENLKLLKNKMAEETRIANEQLANAASQVESLQIEQKQIIQGLNKEISSAEEDYEMIQQRVIAEEKKTIEAIEQATAEREMLQRGWQVQNLCSTGSLGMSLAVLSRSYEYMLSSQKPVPSWGLEPATFRSIGERANLLSHPVIKWRSVRCEYVPRAHHTPPPPYPILSILILLRAIVTGMVQSLYNSTRIHPGAYFTEELYSCKL